MRKQIDDVKDKRLKPRIKTPVVVGSSVVMALTRMGSINALEQTKKNPFWKRWLGAEISSADTIGRVFAQLETDDIRAIIHHNYSRLKRNKALEPACGDLFALIVDGHESSASYYRYCDQCLQRTIPTTKGDRVQYYHRNVTAVLLCKDFLVLLDVELQKPHEDEVAAAMRLIKRVTENYPRAFDLILADGLYARAPFFNLALGYGKDVIAVLKDDRRDLLQDAIGIFNSIEPQVTQYKNTQRKCWDVEHFNTWPQIGREVRVVRSLETTTIRHQTGVVEEKISDWVWVATFSQKKVSTETAINIGHKRWDIENKELNELVNSWSADHVYKHHPTAIEAFWLVIMMAYNLFHAFIYLNLKPEIRHKYTKLHWSRVIAAELYSIPPVPT